MLIKIKYSIYYWEAMRRKNSFQELETWLTIKELVSISSTHKVNDLGFWISFYFFLFVKANIEYISLLEDYLSICAHSSSWGKRPSQLWYKLEGCTFYILFKTALHSWACWHTSVNPAEAEGWNVTASGTCWDPPL